MNEITSNENQYVTAVISHRIIPGRELGYEEWIKGIAADARTFEGHLGVSIFKPKPNESPDYVTVLRFDNCHHLNNWLDSDLHQEWIERVKPLIQEPAKVQILTGLEGWFDLPSRPIQPPPPRYKMAVVTWLGVLITTTILSRLLAPLGVYLPAVLMPLISTGLTVAALTYLIMPNLTRLFYPWLYPKTQERT